MHNIHHYLLQTVPLNCTRFKSVANREPETHWQQCCLGPGKSKELAHASICTPDWRDVTQATKSLALFPDAISLSALDSKSELHSTWHKVHHHSTCAQWRQIRKRVWEELFMSFAVCVSWLAVRASLSLHASSKRNAFIQSHDNFIPPFISFQELLWGLFNLPPLSILSSSLCSWMVLVSLGEPIAAEHPFEVNANWMVCCGQLGSIHSVLMAKSSP